MIDARIFPLGENALTVDFGGQISVARNERVLRFAEYFAQRQFPGFVESVPAYCSLTIFYDAAKVRKNFPESSTAFDAVKNLVEAALKNLSDIEFAAPRIVEIPVCFARELALDLDFVAAQKNLARELFIEIFLAPVYRVFMLGFLPGFAYMGEIDERIASPRRAAPRLNVPAGSVGIAGRQTGIYPFESPGGWQIIGGTTQTLFTPGDESPTFLRAGDAVKFFRVSG